MGPEGRCLVLGVGTNFNLFLFNLLVCCCGDKLGMSRTYRSTRTHAKLIYQVRPGAGMSDVSNRSGLDEYIQTSTIVSDKAIYVP